MAPLVEVASATLAICLMVLAISVCMAIGLAAQLTDVMTSRRARSSEIDCLNKQLETARAEVDQILNGASRRFAAITLSTRPTSMRTARRP
jgi:hypothetical protein